MHTNFYLFYGRKQHECKIRIFTATINSVFIAFFDKYSKGAFQARNKAEYMGA